MMRITIGLFIIVSSIFAQVVCDLEGRKEINFGMSFNEFKALPLQWDYPNKQDFLDAGITEEELAKCSQDEIDWYLSLHTDSFSSYQAVGSAFFYKDKLNTIAYQFSIETQNENKYIDVYFSLKGLLQKKYGTPESIEHLTGIYEDYFPKGQYAGQAISLGSGSYISFWTCDSLKTGIALSLSGDNRKIKLVLRYSDDQFKMPAEEKEAQLLDDF